MSVTTDLQASHKALNVELQEKLGRALSEAERVMALLANAVALHGLYLKYRPFQEELTASGVWMIVTDGEVFAQSSVPSFLNLRMLLPMHPNPFMDEVCIEVVGQGDIGN